MTASCFNCSVFLGIQGCQQLLVLRLEDDGDRSEQEPFEVKFLPASLEVLQTSCKLALKLDMQSEPAHLRVYEGHGTPDYGLTVPGTSSVSLYLP